MGRPTVDQAELIDEELDRKKPGWFKRGLKAAWEKVAKPVGREVGVNPQMMSAEIAAAVPSVPIPGQQDKRWSPYTGIMGGLVEGIKMQNPVDFALKATGQKAKIQKGLEAKGLPSWLISPLEALTTPEMEALGVRDISTPEGMRQEEMGRQTREVLKQTIPQMNPLAFTSPVTGYIEARRKLKDPLMEIHKQRPETEQAQMQILSPAEIAMAPIPVEKGLTGIKILAKGVKNVPGVETYGKLAFNKIFPQKPSLTSEEYVDYLAMGQAKIDDYANGRAKVYHGTDSDFVYFDQDKQGVLGIFGQADYFTDNPKIAGQYADLAASHRLGGKGQGQNVRPVVLKAKRGGKGMFNLDAKVESSSIRKIKKLHTKIMSNKNRFLSNEFKSKLLKVPDRKGAMAEIFMADKDRKLVNPIGMLNEPKKVILYRSDNYLGSVQYNEADISRLNQFIEFNKKNPKNKMEFIIADKESYVYDARSIIPADKRLPLDFDSVEYKNLEKLAREGNKEARNIIEEISVRLSFGGEDAGRASNAANLMPMRSEYNRLMGIKEDAASILQKEIELWKSAGNYDTNLDLYRKMKSFINDNAPTVESFYNPLPQAEQVGLNRNLNEVKLMAKKEKKLASDGSELILENEANDIVMDMGFDMMAYKHVPGKSVFTPPSPVVSSDEEFRVFMVLTKRGKKATPSQAKRVTPAFGRSGTPQQIEATEAARIARQPEIDEQMRRLQTPRGLEQPISDIKAGQEIIDDPTMAWKEIFTSLKDRVKGPRVLRHLGVPKKYIAQKRSDNVGFVSDYENDIPGLMDIASKMAKGLDKLPTNILDRAKQVSKIKDVKAAKQASIWGRATGGAARQIQLLGAQKGSEAETIGRPLKDILFPKKRGHKNQQLAAERKLFGYRKKRLKTYDVDPSDPKYIGTDKELERVYKEGTGKEDDVKGLFQLVFDSINSEHIDNIGKNIGSQKELSEFRKLSLNLLLEDDVAKRKEIIKRLGKLREGIESQGRTVPRSAMALEDVRNYIKGINSLTEAHNTMFNLWHKGIMPNRSQISLLDSFMGTEFTKALTKHRSATIANWLKKYILRNTLRMSPKVIETVSKRMSFGSNIGSYTLGELIKDISSIPKTFRASFDDSAISRQGLIYLYKDPRAWFEAANFSLKLMMAGGEDAARAYDKATRTHPNFRTYTEKLGLAISELDARFGGVGKEEAFVSNLAKFAPWIRPSERAYTTFLNKIRVDQMDNAWRNLEKTLGRKLDITSDVKTSTGIGSMTDLERLKAQADWINNSTGRGRLPFEANANNAQQWKKIALDIANIGFWSPRFLFSRIMLLPSAARAARASGKSPITAVMNEVTGTLVTWLGHSVATLLFFKMLPGADSELNPRSTDFGKITIGNTKFDIFIGMGPLARGLIGLIYERETATGGTVPIDRMETIQRFLTSKMSPVGSAALRYAPFVGSGEGYFGEDADILADMKKSPTQQSSFWYQMLMPMFLESLHDSWDVYTTPMVSEQLANQLGFQPSEPREDWQKVLGILGVLPEFFGISTSVYTTREDIAGELIGQAGLPEDTRYKDIPFRGGPGVVSQEAVKAIISQDEAARGITREKGVTAELKRISTKEQSDINGIGTIPVRAEGITRTVNEWRTITKKEGRALPIEVERTVRERFFNIRRDAATERTYALKDEDWAKPKSQRALDNMSFKERVFYEWRRTSERARTSEEYNMLLEDLERKLENSRNPEAAEALQWLQMNMYGINIPPHILELLPNTTRAKYARARQIKTQHYGATPAIRQRAAGE